MQACALARACTGRPHSFSPPMPASASSSSLMQAVFRCCFAMSSGLIPFQVFLMSAFARSNNLMHDSLLVTAAMKTGVTPSLLALSASALALSSNLRQSALFVSAATKTGVVPSFVALSTFAFACNSKLRQSALFIKAAMLTGVTPLFIALSTFAFARMSKSRHFVLPIQAAVQSGDCPSLSAISGSAFFCRRIFTAPWHPDWAAPTSGLPPMNVFAFRSAPCSRAHSRVGHVLLDMAALCTICCPLKLLCFMASNATDGANPRLTSSMLPSESAWTSGRIWRSSPTARMTEYFMPMAVIHVISID
mmetsp:Transcript_132505/g.411966  ORF Transcript_132505/g.411966 Transcript_132505/m.411966 type:complete len:306 (-) Transcript_132505:428-1345(-)